jgi:hypothetical protein
MDNISLVSAWAKLSAVLYHVGMCTGGQQSIARLQILSSLQSICKDHLLSYKFQCSIDNVTSVEWGICGLLCNKSAEDGFSDEWDIHTEPSDVVVALESAESND